MGVMSVVEVAPALSLDLPPDLTGEQWANLGQSLFHEHRSCQWKLADWIAYGRAKAKTDSTFAEQMALALPAILEDPRKLDAIARVAEVFPVDERSLDLSFDHFAALSRLPHGEARKLLDKAAKDKTGPREIRYEAMQAQMNLAPREPVNEDSLLEGAVHFVNRLPASVRIQLAELLAEAQGKEIDL